MKRKESMKRALTICLVLLLQLLLPTRVSAKSHEFITDQHVQRIHDKGWIEEKGLRGNESITLVVFLEPRAGSREKVNELLYSVSDPESDRFREFLTHEELSRLTVPPQEAVEKVAQWLSTFGGNDIATSNHGNTSQQGSMLRMQLRFWEESMRSIPIGSQTRRLCAFACARMSMPTRFLQQLPR